MTYKTRRAYSWQPDIPNSRYYMYCTIKPVIQLHKKTDLRTIYSKVESEGYLGNLTTQALADNFEFLDNMIDKNYIDVSRLFIYYNERVLMNTVDYDSSASLRVGIKTLKNDGSCPETMWPYNIRKFGIKPKPTCYSEAKAHGYKRISQNNKFR